MKIVLLILTLLMHNSNANEEKYCLFHFKSPKKEFTQRASADVICSHIIERGYEDNYIIASSLADEDNIFILVKVEQIEVIPDSDLGTKIKSTGIKNTAEWFLSLTLDMPYEFNPNLSLKMHKMQYLNGRDGGGNKDRQPSPKNPPSLENHPPAADK